MPYTTPQQITLQEAREFLKQDAFSQLDKKTVALADKLAEEEGMDLLDATIKAAQNLGRKSLTS